MQEAAVASPAAAARLMRYASALQLADKHRWALVNSSVARNMEVGNYG